ncbi:MAG: cyclic nucleotide-binding domain-containing protein [Stackebrandtia sp.]
MQTAYDLLRAHPFLAGLPEGQLRRMAMWSHRAAFHAGARIFNEGRPADRFWLILDGSVVVDANTPDQGIVDVDVIGPGSVLGWSWMTPPYRWHFGATAREDVLAVQLDGKGILRMCVDDPDLGFELTSRFAQVVIQRLHATRRRQLRRTPEAV